VYTSSPSLRAAERGAVRARYIAVRDSRPQDVPTESTRVGARELGGGTAVRAGDSGAITNRLNTRPHAILRCPETRSPLGPQGEAASPACSPDSRRGVARRLLVVIGEGGVFGCANRYPGATLAHRGAKSFQKVAAALGSGPRGRRFKSSRPDQFLKKSAKFSLPGYSVFLPDSTAGTEWSALQIQPSSRIVRDFSPPSLAASPARAPFKTKGYPSRYRASRRRSAPRLTHSARRWHRRHRDVSEDLGGDDDRTPGLRVSP
jgi:hypothetical protein